MADAPGNGDAGAAETAFAALRRAENPANVFALGGLLAQEQPHMFVHPLLVAHQVPEQDVGHGTHQQQTSCTRRRPLSRGGMAGREWRAAGGVRAGSRDFWERVDASGRWWSYPLGIAREGMGATDDCRRRMPGHFLRLGSFGAVGSWVAWGFGCVSCAVS